jgi:hypothetical protein
MTMPSDAGTTTVQRAEPAHTKGVSQLLPLLVAVALLVASGVAAVLISGPMH